jgi:hypothetical protein
MLEEIDREAELLRTLPPESSAFAPIALSWLEQNRKLINQKGDRILIELINASVARNVHSMRYTLALNPPPTVTGLVTSLFGIESLHIGQAEATLAMVRIVSSTSPVVRSFITVSKSMHPASPGTRGTAGNK